MAFTRREVLQLAALTLGAAACGGSNPYGSSSSMATSCVANGTSSFIYANHGHVLTIPAADVVAGVEKTYDIEGSAAHTHSVTITAAMFTQLQNDREAITVSTLDLGHDHSIVVGCL